MKSKGWILFCILCLLPPGAANLLAEASALPPPPPTSISADTPEAYHAIIREILLEWGFTSEEIEILGDNAPVVVTLLTDPEMTAEKLQNIKTGFINSILEPVIGNKAMASIVLNGRVLAFDQPAIIENNQLFLPLRVVCEALGAKVEWNQSAQTAAVTTEEMTLLVQMGSASTTVNGADLGLDVFPLMRSSRILVHEGVISEAFDAEVVWDSGEETVTITSKNQPELALSARDFPIILNEGTEYPLEGVLSIPENTTGKAPAVVFVHGSGPQDRDETIFANKPFRDIAQYLASNGVAVIRYDKRSFTHGAKMAEELGNEITVWEETIEDAIMAAEMLRADPRIDANRVFILGHSLGGMLAPRTHAEGGHFAGIISLAGSPRSLLDITYDQQMLYIDAMPEGEEKALALSQMETYDEQVAALMALSDEEAKNTAVSGNVPFYYFKEMDEHPASAYTPDIAVPFLIMQGERDFQVSVDKDYAAWQELLSEKTNATFKLYANLNHLFMPATGRGIVDFQEEYSIESRVDEQVLADIAEWIHSH
ncbi:MAG: alpha/beta fold hydrolase [Clostridiales bacterium]|nr:alpha/beta fold hydrolase [Clostridiales bacterium]